MLSSGRALELGEAVADDEGKGGSCAKTNRAKNAVAVTRSSGSLMEKRN
jgi:hypothetical protein